MGDDDPVLRRWLQAYRRKSKGSAFRARRSSGHRPRLGRLIELQKLREQVRLAEVAVKPTHDTSQVERL
jgi:hypothetical protein